MILDEVLRGSLTVCDYADKSSIFGYNVETRTQLYNDIINQQMNTMIRKHMSAIS